MCGPVVQIITSCSGSCTDSSRSRSWSTNVKMAVLAPIPRASEATATNVNSLLRPRLRRAIFTSDATPLMVQKLLRQNSKKVTDYFCEWADREVHTTLRHALQNVVFLAVLARDLPYDRPLVAIRNINAPVRVVLHTDLAPQAILLHLAGIPERPRRLGNRKRIHRYK